MEKLKQIQSSRWLDSILLLLVAIVWGTSYGVAKNAVLYYPVLGFIALRFCITSIIFLPIVFSSTKKSITTTIKAGLPLGFVLLLIFVSETYGLSKTSAANSAFLISLYVVFTPFIQWLLLKETPNRKTLIAAFMSIIGAFLLSYQHDQSLQLNLGDYLILLAAVLRATMVTLTKKLTQDREVNMMLLTTVQTSVVGIGCLILGLVIYPQQIIILPAIGEFWLNVIYLVIFCTMFAFFVQNFSVKRTSPTKVALLMGSEPVWGALYATLVMHESLSLTAWVGGLLIVLAMLWATVK